MYGDFNLAFEKLCVWCVGCVLCMFMLMGCCNFFSKEGDIVARGDFTLHDKGKI